MNIKHTACYKKGYPRPQFVRNSFIRLDGKWKFCFDTQNAGEKENYGNGIPEGQSINVPFAYQTAASGINRQTRCDNVWYERELDCAIQQGERLLIHFEGCDHRAKVWLNGMYLGEHSGAYSRFSFDATHAVKEGGNRLVVKAEDDYSCRRPRGKQRATDNSYTCFYVDTTGIWKSVWAEVVPETYIETVHITPDIDALTVKIEGRIVGAQAAKTVSAQILFGEREIAVVEQKVTDSRFCLLASVDCEAHFFSEMEWNSHFTNLYDVKLRLVSQDACDEVGSYFGMVKYRADGNSITVNDSPVYLKMLLDQGYWTDSHLTPPDEQAIVKDILLTLDAGFNGIRKHQKIEDERFYYYCDVLGVYVWCEMPSMYEFCDESASAFLSEWREVVEQMRNHPCIMAYVPFNESWGINRVHENKREQALTLAAYHTAKALDPMRLVISNDGWDHTVSDICTVHHYAEDGDKLASVIEPSEMLANKCTDPPLTRAVYAKGYAYAGQPVMISEYGGIAFAKDGDQGWGYGNLVKNEQEYLERLGSLTRAIQNTPGICGYCLTQTTDVQQEVNGILTEAREWKADAKKLRAINNGENF